MADYFYDVSTAKVIAPEQNSYLMVDIDSIYLSETKGGKLRTRLDSLNASKNVAVTWVLNRSEYVSFRDFYTNFLNNGSRNFTVELYVDKSTLTTHVASIIPNTLKLTQQSGDSYTISCELRCNSIEFTNDDYLEFLSYNIVNLDGNSLLDGRLLLTGFENYANVTEI